MDTPEITIYEPAAANEIPYEDEEKIELPAENTVEAETVIETEVPVEAEQIRVNPPIPPGGRANMGRRRRRHRKDN